VKKQAGFTIIELVMVIVILGILSAFALPKFANFGSDARAASLAGVAGAMRSGAAIAHAEQLVRGVTGGTDVTLEGEAIKMVEGYPTADNIGIVVAAGIDEGSYTVFTAGDANAGSTYVIGYTDTTCIATYTAANSSSYNVAIETSGC
jgi:MSHA pilin protein MshA